MYIYDGDAKVGIHGELEVFLFFFQAEDGIRDYKVTGVQTCALPISSSTPMARSATPTSARATTGRPRVRSGHSSARPAARRSGIGCVRGPRCRRQIGRASCRERV